MTNKTIDDFVHDEVHISASGLIEEIIDLRNGSRAGVINRESTSLEEFDFDNIEWPRDEETNWKREVFEWLIISSWLADKLKAQNECIIKAGFVNIWGRTCTGQGVAMDSVIKDIYRAMMEA